MWPTLPAYSTAEFQHGPISLLSEGIPVVIVVVRGPSFHSSCEMIKKIQAMGSDPYIVAPAGTIEANLEFPTPINPVLDGVVAIQKLYPLIANLAIARNHDPDKPKFLSKITKTL